MHPAWSGVSLAPASTPTLAPVTGTRARFEAMWADLHPVGRSPVTAGYRRFAWSEADLTCREWFVGEAVRRGLDVTVDRNGNQWAWWGDPDGGGAVATGSHLDSVPDGGAFDGPLGVVSALAAVDLLRDRDVRPVRPLALVNFTDEEGARFGVPCAGSRLMTGDLDPDRARSLRDADGTTMAEAMSAAGHDPAHLGRGEEDLGRLGAFVELHVEQGRALVDRFAAVGVARGIRAHGRWRLDLYGQANHAGTTRLADRDDPMLRLAAAVLAARESADRHAALATIGKVNVEPGGTNAIPSLVRAWLDARGDDEAAVRAVVAAVGAAGAAEPVEESWSPEVTFGRPLRDRIAGLLGGAPVLSTGAGHDAGVLSGAGLPAAMLFVRNPTGVSHSPAEHADIDDCLAGVEALATVLADLLTGQS